MWVNGAKERWMNFYQVYLASLVDGLRESSDSEALRRASEKAGRDLAIYMNHLGMETADVVDALALLNAAMGLADRFRVSAEDGALMVMVHKPTCRMCPGLINGSGQPTRKCPLYGLVRGFLEGQGIAALEYDSSEPTNGGEWCVLRYKVEGSRARSYRTTATGGARVCTG